MASHSIGLQLYVIKTSPVTYIEVSDVVFQIGQNSMPYRVIQIGAAPFQPQIMGAAGKPLFIVDSYDILVINLKPYQVIPTVSGWFELIPYKGNRDA